MEPTPLASEHFETPSEHLANSITHGIGIVLSIVALSLLVTLASLRHDLLRVISFCIYGGSLVLLYCASTCFHSVRHPRARHWLKVLDHSAIYALIAGTYTPFLLVMLRGVWGWSLFATVWGITFIGTILKLFYVHRFERTSTALYVAMGWIGVIAAKPFLATVPVPAICWLAAGGLAYMGGVVFFFWDRLPFNHAIWHLFVLAGSVCHFFGVYWYVLPAHAGV